MKNSILGLFSRMSSLEHLLLLCSAKYFINQVSLHWDTIFFISKDITRTKEKQVNQ